MVDSFNGQCGVFNVPKNGLYQLTYPATFSYDQEPKAPLSPTGCTGRSPTPDFLSHYRIALRRNFNPALLGQSTTSGINDGSTPPVTCLTVGGCVPLFAGDTVIPTVYYQNNDPENPVLTIRVYLELTIVLLSCQNLDANLPEGRSSDNNGSCDCPLSAPQIYNPANVNCPYGPPF
jgi:hypothetical protein